MGNRGKDGLMITVITREMDLFLCNLREIIFSVPVFGDAMSCRNSRATAEPAGSETCSISVLPLAPEPVLLYCTVQIEQFPRSQLQ